MSILKESVCNFADGRIVDLKKSDVLLEPFCGSGTTLVEARLLGIPEIGIEISTLSALISCTKSTFAQDIIASYVLR